MVKDLAIGSESAGTVTLDYDPGALRDGPEYHLNLQLVAPAARGLLPAGHAYARAQIELPSRPGNYAVGPKQGSLTVDESETMIFIRGDGFDVGIGRDTGLLSSLTWSGQELLLTPLAPNLWRAPTDNDFGNYMHDWAADWEQAGRNRTLRALDVSRMNADRIAVTADFSLANDPGEEVARWKAMYTVFRDGRVEVSNRFERDDDLPVVPRIGMNVELVGKLDNIEWFGRGPFENYVDRRLAAHVGRYRNTVADHYVPYPRPQENGYKTDVRWLSLDDGSDTGLLVIAGELIGFSAHRNRMADFTPPVKIAITSEDGPGARDDSARVNIHVNDIAPRDIVSLNIDHGQMGVGGDDSWGKRTLQKYSLTESVYEYRFTLWPYERTSGRLDELVSR